VLAVIAQQGDFVIENDMLTAYRGSAAEVVVPEGVTAIGGLPFTIAAALAP
jgi:hypothetical protein